MEFDLSTLDSYRDDDLLQELRRVAGLVEGPRLTQEKFNEHSKVHADTVRRRFGGWGKALQQAGLAESASPQARDLSDKDIVRLAKKVAASLDADTLSSSTFYEHTGISQKVVLRRFPNWKTVLAEAGLQPVALGRRYTDEQCFENVLMLWTHYGRQPKFGELKQPPSTVGPKAYTLRWGGWRKALRAFVDQVESPRLPEPMTEPTSTADDQPQPVPRSLSLSLRYKILKRDNFTCVLCGRSPANKQGIELHVDHIQHWSRGGTNDPDNLRTTCSDCNLGRGDKD